MGNTPWKLSTTYLCKSSWGHLLGSIFGPAAAGNWLMASRHRLVDELVHCQYGVYGALSQAEHNGHDGKRRIGVHIRTLLTSQRK